MAGQQPSQQSVVVNTAITTVFFESKDLAYNYKTDQWSVLPVYTAANYFGIEGKAQILGRVSISVDAVDLQTQSGGVDVTAILTTGEIDPNTGGRSIMQGVRPLVNGGTIRVRTGVRDDQTGTDRTNLIFRSETFNSLAWTNTRSTDTQNVGTAPDGSNTANSLDEDGTAGNTHFIAQVFTGTDDEDYAFSVYLKASNRTWARIAIVERDGTQSGGYFDLTNGVVGATPDTGVTQTMVDVGNGWYRCGVSVDIGSGGTSEGIQIIVAEADNDILFNGLTQESILVWGSMVELASAPTSYIETTNTTATDDVNWTEFRAPHSRTGFANNRNEGRYHRVETRISGGFDTAMGADIDFSGSGKV